MNSTAFIFPGQGSQSIGMLSDIAEKYPKILNTFDKASETLGYDLWQLAQNGPKDQLNQTEYTQAVMLTGDVAIYKALAQEKTIKPTHMAGHSLGEYAALVCSEALTIEDGVKLVSIRGRLMQEFVPLGEGAMAAIIGMTDEEVDNICIQATTNEKKVTPANYNAPGQVVVAGHTSAVEKAIKLAEENGARMATIIPVSVPCHCELLKTASEIFKESLGETRFSTPNCRVISNVDLSIYQTADDIRRLLQQQLYSPVRWVETIQLMKVQGVNSLIESGSGKVLSGLVRRIDKSLITYSTHDLSSFEKALVLFNQ